MEKVNLKILSDIHCELYVDSEFVTDIKKDTLIKIPLPTHHKISSRAIPLLSDHANLYSSSLV